jgi:tetratricopeptide (TPR) repeat protein
MEIVMPAIANKEFEQALEAIDSLIEKYPHEPELLVRRLQILLAAKQFEPAVALFNDVVKEFGDRPETIYGFAWTIALAEDASPDLLNAGLLEMERLVEKTKEEDAGLLDTLARLHFKLGHMEDAVEWQTKAVKLDADPIFGRHLDEYRAVLTPPEDAVALPVETAEADSETVKPEAPNSETADSLDEDSDAD